METDSFFCQLLKQLPGTLFELLGLPGDRARSYHFESVELKKAFRIDGLFTPKESRLPLYFVEVQFQLVPNFYANLFAKVFCFLEENDPAQDWNAVAVFASRSVEPRHLGPYEDLLRSTRIRRIYLDELSVPPDPPLGMGILQLVNASRDEEKPLVTRLVRQAESEISDGAMLNTVIELVEGLLYRRHAHLTREEVLDMFHLTQLHKTRAWQKMHEDAVNEGLTKGREEGMEKGLEKGLEKGKELAQNEFVQKCRARGMSAREIADLAGLSVAQVRRLAKKNGKKK